MTVDEIELTLGSILFDRKTIKYEIPPRTYELSDLYHVFQECLELQAQ